MSKYLDRRSRTSSASQDSDKEVNPTRSANSTETSRRSVSGASREAAGAASWSTAVWSPIGAPHSPQNFAPTTLGDPHEGQATARRAPHSPQNLRPGSLSEPHDVQRMCSFRRQTRRPQADPLAGERLAPTAR